jgi:hypothetical protein
LKTPERVNSNSVAPAAWVSAADNPKAKAAAATPRNKVPLAAIAHSPENFIGIEVHKTRPGGPSRRWMLVYLTTGAFCNWESERV